MSDLKGIHLADGYIANFLLGVVGRGTVFNERQLDRYLSSQSHWLERYLFDQPSATYVLGLAKQATVLALETAEIRITDKNSSDRVHLESGHEFFRQQRRDRELRKNFYLKVFSSKQVERDLFLYCMIPNLAAASRDISFFTTEDSLAGVNPHDGFSMHPKSFSTSASQKLFFEIFFRAYFYDKHFDLKQRFEKDLANRILGDLTIFRCAKGKILPLKLLDSLVGNVRRNGLSRQNQFFVWPGKPEWESHQRNDLNCEKDKLKYSASVKSGIRLGKQRSFIGNATYSLRSTSERRVLSFEIKKLLRRLLNLGQHNLCISNAKPVIDLLMCKCIQLAMPSTAYGFVNGNPLSSDAESNQIQSVLYAVSSIGQKLSFPFLINLDLSALFLSRNLFIVDSLAGKVYADICMLLKGPRRPKISKSKFASAFQVKENAIVFKPGAIADAFRAMRIDEGIKGLVTPDLLHVVSRAVISETGFGSNLQDGANDTEAEVDDPARSHYFAIYGVSSISNLAKLKIMCGDGDQFLDFVRKHVDPIVFGRIEKAVAFSLKYHFRERRNRFNSKIRFKRVLRRRLND